MPADGIQMRAKAANAYEQYANGTKTKQIKRNRKNIKAPRKQFKYCSIINQTLNFTY